MTIQPKITHALQTILLTGGHENATPSISETSLENFMTAYGDKAFTFFPEYPSLPNVKYLLWNYENLRPGLKTIFQPKISALWNLTDPAPEAEIALEQAPTNDLPNALDEKKAATEPDPPIRFHEPEMSHCSGITRKQDAFDRFLDVVAMFVRAVSFS